MPLWQLLEYPRPICAISMFCTACTEHSEIADIYLGQCSKHILNKVTDELCVHVTRR